MLAWPSQRFAGTLKITGAVPSTLTTGKLALYNNEGIAFIVDFKKNENMIHQLEGVEQSFHALLSMECRLGI